MRTITLVTLALLLLCCLPTSVAQAQVAVVAPVNPTPTTRRHLPRKPDARSSPGWISPPPCALVNGRSSPGRPARSGFNSWKW